MPISAKRTCSYHGCPNVSDKSYCELHYKEKSHRWNHTETTTQRGYGSSWRKLRYKILERDNYLCQCSDCKEQGRIIPAGEVDHIIPKAKGGTDDPSNLQAINRECHKAKTNRERC